MDNINSSDNLDVKLTTDIPWTEKYRPTGLKNIVLDPLNRKILNNIIIKKSFPNVLFYGPPGTGKTTTIISLIKEYNEYHGYNGKELIMHLNASDERGIDVIRNQIHNFVNTNMLFGKGLKFVILDEVDYMTKTAQIALKNLLLNYKNVRYCLICNYISKIDKSLQEHFINFRFNQLPNIEITNFIKNIITYENIKLTNNDINTIMSYFKSDIRSMINYIQLNFITYSKIKLVKEDTFRNLYYTVKDNIYITEKEFYNKLINISKKYNICISDCMKRLCFYINEQQDFINETQYIIHNLGIKDSIMISYLLSKLKLSFINSLSTE